MQAIRPDPDASPKMPHGPAGKAPFKGFAMGLADAVPGISGGTVALILGIHPRLVKAIAGLGASAAKHVRGRQWAAAWRDIDGNFLTLLAIGIAVGLVAGARAVGWAIAEQPIPLMAFLLGLMAASVRLPARVPAWDAADWVIMALAALAAAALALVPALAAPTGWWFLPVAGAIAACAMILPGISGSALLVLMGLYEPIIHAVGALDLIVIGLVGVGAAVGLLSFSKGLRRLLERHEGPTHAGMVGLLVGSLVLLWPWRSQAGFAHGVPVLPTTAAPATWIFVGALVIWGIERLGRRHVQTQSA